MAEKCECGGAGEVLVFTCAGAAHSGQVAMVTPALAVNGEVKLVGKVASEEEIKKILQSVDQK